MKTQSFKLSISPDGVVTMIYDDMHAAMRAEGISIVTRASHVEPASAGGWGADMGPVGGEILGPFPLRSVALHAEVKYLNQILF